MPVTKREVPRQRAPGSPPRVGRARRRSKEQGTSRTRSKAAFKAGAPAPARPVAGTVEGSGGRTSPLAAERSRAPDDFAEAPRRQLDRQLRGSGAYGGAKQSCAGRSRTAADRRTRKCRRERTTGTCIGSAGYALRDLGALRPARAKQGRGASALLSAETREAAHLPCLAGEQGSELTAPKSYRPTSSAVARLVTSSEDLRPGLRLCFEVGTGISPDACQSAAEGPQARNGAITALPQRYWPRGTQAGMRTTRDTAQRAMRPALLLATLAMYAIWTSPALADTLVLW
jgi:hypothetical protein